MNLPKSTTLFKENTRHIIVKCDYTRKNQSVILTKRFYKRKFLNAVFLKRRMIRTITFGSPMRIFVNTGVLLHDGSEDYHCFLNEVLKIVIDRNRDYEFIILSANDDARLFLAGNVTHVKVHPIMRYPLAVKIWYDLKLPATLKKHKADVFISFDGLCSLTTEIPQVILFNPLMNDYSGANSLRSLFYKHFMQKAIQKANTIICCGDFRKKDVVLRYIVNANKLAIVYPAINETWQPFNENVKEEIRMKYCDGKNYFVYMGLARQRQDIVNILRAFSAFKKRQKSNWKLLLMGRSHQYDRKFMDSLAAYKYRSDVVVAKNDTKDELARLIGSAYAVLCAVHSEPMIFPLLKAMNRGVPVIAADTPAGREIAGDEALYFDPLDSESIARQMMTLYKDESFRNTLIENGKVTASKYSFDNSAALFWESITGTKLVFKPHGLD